ncbi:MAG: lamin tail domain-containing protein [Pyrinomonadaceae bacterium]
MRLTRTLVRLCGALAATFALSLVLSAAQTALAVSPNVVISQVYGGAGCGTAGCSTYQNDFIELFNRSTAPVSLNGWSVQYAAATGTAWQVTALPNVMLQPGQYFLVAESFGANGVNPLPTPDASGTIAMSATAAKVAVVNVTTALTGACPTGAQIVDFIGYGATATCSETANAPAPSTTTADKRNGNGLIDTDNNSTDFTAAAPTPRNTASPMVTITPPPFIISEFRLRGPSGANDEFVEIYNNSTSDVTVNTTDGSAGYALVASDGTARFTVPNGTVIPARGHYLGVNSGGYSLASYPAGNGTTATGDATYTTDIADNAGIALFSTATPANFTLANRLDAVGSTSEANTLYKEGTGYPAINPAFNIEQAFYRDNCGKQGSITNSAPCTAGTPQDTDNNATDFIYVDTNGTSAGAGQRLGAPGPENLSSPVQRNASIKSSFIDPGCTGNATVATQACPRYRDATPAPGSPTSSMGTLSIRRRFVNNTGAAVTRLRFRIVDITTFPAPSGTADLRAITSPDQPAICQGTGNGCSGPGAPITINGTTLETPPSQPNGGAFNSTLSAGTITLGTPLANGAGINLQFLLGVQQAGAYRFFINVEALPGASPITAPATLRGAKVAASVKQ